MYFFVLKAESLYTSLIDGRLDINKVELQKNSLLVINDSIEKHGRKISNHKFCCYNQFLYFS